jgi:AcrR family transcriptional regulator
METIITEQFRKTILRDALKIFKAEGVRGLQEKDLIKKLGISAITLANIASDKDDLFKKAVYNDMEEQRLKQDELLTRPGNALHHLLGLLTLSLENTKEIGPAYLADYITYPDLLQAVEREIDEHAIPLYRKLLNEGIQEGVFRKDINIDIVTKVIMQNIYVLLNFKVFPPERYNTGEVLRSIYLYYFRGLCETESARMVDNYFS